MSDTEHVDLIAAADAWAQRRLAELGQREPESFEAAVEQLKAGAGLAVCTVVAGSAYQLDLCLIGPDRRMRSLVSVTSDAPGKAGKH